MFKKATIALIAVMSCFALIGVGFSSWAMGAGNTVERSSTGKLSSEKVTVSDDYIKINREKMEELNKKTFVVSPHGFVNTKADNTTSMETTGTLQIPLTVDMQKCYGLSQTALQVSITVSLESTSDLLTATEFMSLSCSDSSITQLQGNGLRSTKEYFKNLENYNRYLYNTDFVADSTIINSFVFSMAFQTK